MASPNNKMKQEIVSTLKREFKGLEKENIILVLLEKDKLVFKKIKNISKSKVVHFVGEPNEYLNMLKDTQFLSDTPKYKLLGLAHNHPNSEAVPSQLDLDNWRYDIDYYIYSNLTNELKVYDKNGNTNR